MAVSKSWKFQWLLLESIFEERLNRVNLFAVCTLLVHNEFQNGVNTMKRVSVEEAATAGKF